MLPVLVQAWAESDPESEVSGVGGPTDRRSSSIRAYVKSGFLKDLVEVAASNNEPYVVMTVPPHLKLKPIGGKYSREPEHHVMLQGNHWGLQWVHGLLEY